jgi:hypothetical protein
LPAKDLKFFLIFFPAQMGVHALVRSATTVCTKNKFPAMHVLQVFTEEAAGGT